MEQETVEEYFLDDIKNMLQFNNDALAIRFMEKYYHAKKEQERMYSEEEVNNIFYAICKHSFFEDNVETVYLQDVKDEFEQFKNKEENGK